VTFASYALFLTASLALAITPGPAVLYIVTRSISQGRRAAVASTLGIAVGSLVHIAAATMGLSVVLATSAIAFTAVKLAGAGYLIWLGYAKLTGTRSGHELTPTAPSSLSRVFAQGVVVNVLNPKTALFFLAFLPQFVRADATRPGAEFVMLGLLFTAIAFVTDTAWGLLAERAGSWLRAHPRFVERERYISGTIYLGLGVATAFSGSARSK
jgi:threonine/homoserine/homoserine lactone efflux protein